MMTIEDAVDLVVYAFQHGRAGDTFVQKAPACTIEVLTLALQRLLGVRATVNVIGTRHGEKLYETLLTREEMAVAEDMGNYFRVPADNRDLNYSLFFSQGQREVSRKEDFHSHNAPRLGVDEMCELLLRLACVRDAVAGKPVEI
jgi:UDP-glucose 4-epimerase